MGKGNPTNGELAIMLENLHEKIDRIDKIGGDTNKKATATNGRVTKLEDVVKALNELITKHDNALFDSKDGIISWRDKFKGSMMTIKVAYPILAVVITTLFGLYITNLKNEIAHEVSIQLLETPIQIIEE